MSLRRLFVVREHHLISSLVDDAVSAEVPVVGQRVKALQELNYQPHAVIAAGEQGTIDYINAESGLIEIQMDNYHAGLGEWFNHIWLVPFDSDEVVDDIALIGS